MSVVGIDLGGTGLRAGVVAPNGAVSSLRAFEHGGLRRPVDAIDAVVRSFEAVSAGAPVEAVGVGVAGLV